MVEILVADVFSSGETMKRRHSSDDVIGKKSYNTKK